MSVATFEFYCEMSQGRTIATAYESPDSIMTERDIERAVKKFAKKQKLDLAEYDHLTNDSGYRVFLEGRKKKGDFVYYVAEKNGE